MRPTRCSSSSGEGLQQYQVSWGRLPQVKIPAGPALKRGSTGKRVALLRTRLGLAPGGGYDDQLFAASWRTTSGSTASARPTASPARRRSPRLNRGAAHYARRIAINVERAFRLPPARTFDRYVVVDSGAAETYLFDRDRLVDSMR